MSAPNQFSNEEKGLFLVALGNQMRHHNLMAGAALDGSSHESMLGELFGRGMDADRAREILATNWESLTEVIDDQP